MPVDGSCRMSGPSQLQAGQQEMDSVKAEIQQNLQAFVAARQAGNVNEIGLLGKRLEQLGEEKLVLRRAQAAG